jgi:hypothetical protein
MAGCGHQVVAVVGNAEDLLAAIGGHQADITVVDVRMPPSCATWSPDPSQHRDCFQNMTPARPPGYARSNSSGRSA